MRRVSNVLARSLAVAVVVCAMSVPAEARSSFREPSFSAGERVVKTVKRWAQRLFGDLMSVPKP